VLWTFVTNVKTINDLMVKYRDALIARVVPLFQRQARTD
jgi:hypothetical protein